MFCRKSLIQYAHRKRVHFIIEDATALVYSDYSEICSEVDVLFRISKENQVRVTVMYLHNGSVVKPEEVSVEFPESIQMEGVDGDVGGHLAVSPPNSLPVLVQLQGIVFVCKD